MLTIFKKKIIITTIISTHFTIENKHNTFLNNILNIDSLMCPTELNNHLKKNNLFVLHSLELFYKTFIKLDCMKIVAKTNHPHLMLSLIIESLKNVSNYKIFNSLTLKKH